MYLKNSFKLGYFLTSQGLNTEFVTENALLKSFFHSRKVWLLARKASKMLDLKFVVVPVSILYDTPVLWTKHVFQRREGENFVFFPNNEWLAVQEGENPTKQNQLPQNTISCFPDARVGYLKSNFVNTWSSLLTTLKVLYEGRSVTFWVWCHL